MYDHVDYTYLAVAMYTLAYFSSPHLMCNCLRTRPLSLCLWEGYVSSNNGAMGFVGEFECQFLFYYRLIRLEMCFWNISSLLLKLVKLCPSCLLERLLECLRSWMTRNICPSFLQGLALSWERIPYFMDKLINS